MSNPVRTEEELNKFTTWIQQLFRNAYYDATPYLKRAETIQKAFDCQIDDTNWTTVSEVFFPILRSAVMYVLPYVFQYLFPKDGFIELIPSEEQMKFEDVAKIEQFLEDLLIFKMKIRKDGLLTLQDALKFGCGYGIVENKVITPAAVTKGSAIAGGKLIGKKNVMTAGAPREVVSYRYLPYAFVIPTQDGDTPEDVTCVFQLDFLREDVLNNMYSADKAKPEDEQVYQGDVKKIIKDTRERKLDGSMYYLWWIMSEMSGVARKVLKHNDNVLRVSDGDNNGPVLVPILKCYFKNHHVWLANGNTIIYEEQDTYQTLRCPIIKATATPDAGNWYANSDVSASQDVADGIVIFKNSILDLMTYWLHPPVIYNQEMMSNANTTPDTGPFGLIKVHGVDDVSRAITHMAGPPIPEAVAGYGMQMESDLAHATGRSMAIEQNQLGGLTRAGSGATESLLQNMSARQELIAGVFQMDWLENVVLNVLGHLQTNDQEMSTMIRDNEAKAFKQLKVTKDDIRHVFEARINFGGENKSVNDKLVDIQLYQLMIKGNPYFNQIAPVADIIGANKVARWKATEDEIRRNIEVAQQQQANSLTNGQQAVAGGAASRGAN